MGVQSTIELPDGSSPAVVKSFLPRGSQGTQTGKRHSVWKETSTSAAIGWPQIEELYTQASAKADGTGIEQYLWTIKLPRLQTVGTNDAGITPVPGIAFQTLARIGFNVPLQASQQELNDITQFVASLSADYIRAVIRSRNPAW